MMKTYDPLAINRHLFLKKCSELELSAKIECILTQPMADKPEKEKEEIAALLFKILSRANSEREILEMAVKTFGSKIMTRAVEYLKMLNRLKEKTDSFIGFLANRSMAAEEKETLLSKLNEEERIDEMLLYIKEMGDSVTNFEIFNKAEGIAQKHDIKKKFMWTLSYYYINGPKVEAMLRLLPTMQQQKELIAFTKENYRTVTTRDIWYEAKRISAKYKTP